MVTVYREAGFRFVIFSDDHEPAHVHVVGNALAKVSLVGAGGSPELVYSGGFKQGDVRKFMEIIRRQRALLLKKWKDIHG